MSSWQTLLRDVPDFPRPGILFKDITPVLADADAFAAAIEAMAAPWRGMNLEAVVGIESRGFILGAALARELGIGFVPVRKPGKLPAAHMSVEYSLEYGQSQLDIHEDALRPGDRAYVVDDLLATGGTALAAAKLVELLGAQVAGFGFVIELEGLHGRQRLAAYPCRALLAYA
jgi:adenine phosphoribosyltransferase